MANKNYSDLKLGKIITAKSDPDDAMLDVIQNPKNKIITNEIKKIEILKKKISLIKKSKLSHIQKIYYLINDCKKYGTLPFAGIARCAFISKSILDSLRLINLINDKDLEKFNQSINTISKKINYDYYKANQKKIYNKFLFLINLSFNYFYYI